jgi:hypothetical protein
MQEPELSRVHQRHRHDHEPEQPAERRPRKPPPASLQRAGQRRLAAPDRPGPDFDLAVEIEETELKTMNDLLRPT